MIRSMLPETPACPEVSLMTGNSANVPWTLLNTQHMHTQFIHIQYQVWIKSVFQQCVPCE